MIRRPVGETPLGWGADEGNMIANIVMLRAPRIIRGGGVVPGPGSRVDLDELRQPQMHQLPGGVPNPRMGPMEGRVGPTKPGPKHPWEGMTSQDRKERLSYRNPIEVSR